MLSLAGWVVVQILDGEMKIAGESIYNKSSDCYNSLVVKRAFGVDADNKDRFQCFFIEGKEVKFELKEVK